jgi:hypothetical protein
MRSIAAVWLLLLAVQPSQAQERTKEEEKKPLSAKEQFYGLQKEIALQKQEIVKKSEKASREERQRLSERYFSVDKNHAGKIYQIAEQNPKDAVAVDAIFWVLQYGQENVAVFAKAAEKARDLLNEIPLTDSVRRLRAVRGSNAPGLEDAWKSFLEMVLQRAQRDAKDPAGGDLLAWIVTNGRGNRTNVIQDTALARLIETYPDHAVLEDVCRTLSRSNIGERNAPPALKLILGKTSKSSIKAAAAIGLAHWLETKNNRLGDRLDEAEKTAQEAEKYFLLVVEQYGKDQPALLKQAERDLKAFRKFRVGKIASDIAAGDLDEKPFKLSDYRGKVVLLDFWGHW